MFAYICIVWTGWLALPYEATHNQLVENRNTFFLSLDYTNIISDKPHKPKSRHNNTCTCDAALSVPATPPPTTLPSAPANDTLKPLGLLRWPSLSENKNEPDNEMISNWPCM
nr:hypothetical protein Iba_chr04aCG22280 [Ipomoea batatas]